MPSPWREVPIGTSAPPTRKLRGRLPRALLQRTPQWTIAEIPRPLLVSWPLG